MSKLSKSPSTQNASFSTREMTVLENDGAQEKTRQTKENWPFIIIIIIIIQNCFTKTTILPMARSILPSGHQCPAHRPGVTSGTHSFHPPGRSFKSACKAGMRSLNICMSEGYSSRCHATYNNLPWSKQDKETP